MPRSMHLQTEIYPNLKSISELLKMYMKVSIILNKHHEINESRATRHWTVSAFTESDVFYFTNLDKKRFKIIKHFPYK